MSHNIYEYEKIKYKTPEVHLLDNTNLVFAEFFARTAYDSFDKSENTEVQELHQLIKEGKDISELLDSMSTEMGSELLEQLSHVYFHESTLEHICFNFYISGISRALLQELVRHRLVSYTVKSTRYTMTDVLHAFISSTKFATSDATEREMFISRISPDMFTIADQDYIRIELMNMFEKLVFQKRKLGYEQFRGLIIPKSLIEAFENTTNIDEALAVLKTKSKRNIGDPFKHIVSENLSVDLGLTINLRSLKNMFDLRLNASAWFQFQVLMNEIFKVIPANYMKLINNGKMDSSQQRIEERIKNAQF